MIRLDGSGNVVGNRCFGGSGGDRFQDIHILPSGNAIVVGYTNSIDGDISTPLGNWDIWATCLTPDLDIVWQRTLGGSLADMGESIAPASDGGVVIAGLSLSADGDLISNNGEADLWVVKLEPWDDTGLQTPIDDAGITVYPNPAHDLLTVDLGELVGAGWELRIIDALGRTVLSDALGQQRFVRIPVAQLRAGTYCALLHRNDEVHARRFIKLH